MSDQNGAQTPVGDLEEKVSDSVTGQSEQNIGARPDSDEASEKRSRLEEMYEVRERAKFMRWLGLEDDEAVALYHRMRLSTLAGDQAMLEDMPSERIEGLRAELESRLRRMPRFAFPEFRSRFRIGSRVKANSAIMENVGENADELARMLILSSEMIVRLSQKLDEQMDLHEALSARMDAARSMEDKAVESIPAWLVDAARMIEAMGFDRASLRSKGREISEGFLEVLDRYADKDIGSDSVASRMSERLAHSIDASTDDDDLKSDDHLFPLDVSNPDEQPASDGSPVPSDSVSAMANGDTDMPGDTSGDNGNSASEQPDQGAGDKPQASSAIPMVGAFFGPDIRAKGPSDQDESKPRANGFALIEGVDFIAGYDGCFSQFDRKSASPADASIMARMEERAALDMEQVTLMDGVLPDIAWTKYEVPAGDYVLVQMRGHSAVLPRLREDMRAPGKVSGMMPPYVSMIRYGEMVGLADKDLKALSAWDRPSTGPDHLSASRLDGGRGDPVLAYEVMKRAVAMHLPGVIDADQHAHIDERTIEHMARFWLFMVIGRMRPEQLELLWPGGFFHGVEGHDVGLGNEGHMRLVRRMAGSIEHAIDPGVSDNTL